MLKIDQVFAAKCEHLGCCKIQYIITYIRLKYAQPCSVLETLANWFQYVELLWKMFIQHGKQIYQPGVATDTNDISSAQKLHCLVNNLWGQIWFGSNQHPHTKLYDNVVSLAIIVAFCL